MKKLLAMALAVVMTCGVMTACGSEDESSKKETKKSSETTTTTTAPAETDAPDTTTTPAQEEPEVPQARPLEEIADDLANKDNASITFTAESDISYITMFNEAKADLLPGDEGYNGDEAILNFAVEELSGVTMLKATEELYAKDADGNLKHQGWKIRIDMGKLFEGKEDKLPEIFTVKADCVIVGHETFTGDDGTETANPVPAWCGGAFGTNNNGAWNGNMSEWSIGEYTSEWAYTELLCRPGVFGGDALFSGDFETNYLTLMMWAPTSNVDLYLADIVFEDADGNVITLD